MTCHCCDWKKAKDQHPHLVYLLLLDISLNKKEFPFLLRRMSQQPRILNQYFPVLQAVDTLHTVTAGLLSESQYGCSLPVHVLLYCILAATQTDKCLQFRYFKIVCPSMSHPKQTTTHLSLSQLLLDLLGRQRLGFAQIGCSVYKGLGELDDRGLGSKKKC